jgi:hypothetical protein
MATAVFGMPPRLLVASLVALFLSSICPVAHALGPTEVVVATGTIEYQLPAQAARYLTADEAVFIESGCAKNVTSGIQEALIDIRSYSGKTLKLYVTGADTDLQDSVSNAPFASSDLWPWTGATCAPLDFVTAYNGYGWAYGDKPLVFHPSGSWLSISGQGYNRVNAHFRLVWMKP